MKSKGLYGRKFLDIISQEREIPALDEDHVLVKIHACGVCGTDINFVRDWEKDYMPLGHEVAGEVVEAGKNVTSVKPGDRVIIEDCSMCGICTDCKSGRPDLCRSMYSMEGQPGMSRFMSVRYNCLNQFEGIDYKYACLTEPLAVSLTSVLNADIPPGGSVMVLGPGPLGLMSARLAKIRGAGFVGIVGLPADNQREQARLKLAEEFGCDLVLQTGRDDVESEVKKKFTKGVDRVIVSSPPESIYDALKIIRFGGIITFYGLHFGGKSVVKLDINDLIFRKISLKPTFAEPAINFPLVIHLLREGLVDAPSIVTHTFGFSETKEIMGAIIDGSKPIIKAVLLPHEKGKPQ